MTGPGTGPGPGPGRAGPGRAVVAGGGLAGITAALALCEQGWRVTLLEARPRLGGATCSFDRDGLTVDTGQHVFLRCCTSYLGLLDRLGVADAAPVQSRFDVTVLAPGGPGGHPDRARLRRVALPAPGHLGPALARYRYLTLAERAMVSRAVAGLARLDPADPAVDAVSLGDWLAGHGQGEHVRRVLWDLFTVSALNIAGDQASLALAATVVQTGLLGRGAGPVAGAGNADIGVPARPLGELHGTAAETRLAELGAEVRLRAKVTEVSVLDPAGQNAARPGLRVVLRGDEVLEADAVVLAVPPEQAAALLPPEAVPPAEVAAWTGLGASPILNVHVIYDRPVLDRPFVAAVRSPVQWIFDRTSISGLGRRGAGRDAAGRDGSGQDGSGRDGSGQDGSGRDGSGRDGAGPQYLALSQSAADAEIDDPVATLRGRYLPALAELLPAARDARVTDFFVTRERRATFRQRPGTAAFRPGPVTKLPGLVLAGSWTATGWPDTMEGAVRSGLAAAAALRSRNLALPRPTTTTQHYQQGERP